PGGDQRRTRAHRLGHRSRPRDRARSRVRSRGPDLVAGSPLPSRHRSPGASVIPRYSLPEIADLFTDEARFGAWLEVEVLAVEAWSKLGVVPADAARAVRERARVDVAAVHEREKVTDHDVAAFVDVAQASVGLPAGAWVHYGLTSSDVVDTALALQMTRAL